MSKKTKIIIAVVGAVVALGVMATIGILVFRLLTTGLSLDSGTPEHKIEPAAVAPTEFFDYPLDVGELKLPKHPGLTTARVGIYDCVGRDACDIYLDFEGITRDDAMLYLSKIAASGYDVSWSNILADREEYKDDIDASIQKNKREVATATYSSGTEDVKSSLSINTKIVNKIAWPAEVLGGASDMLTSVDGLRQFNGSSSLTYDANENIHNNDNQPAPAWSVAFSGYDRTLAPAVNQYATGPSLTSYGLQNAEPDLLGSYYNEGKAADGSRVQLVCSAGHCWLYHVLTEKL